MTEKKRIPIILGTDWWTDCDDIVAMRVLAWANDEGLIKIKGINIDACMPFSAPSLDAYLTAEGLPNINIGIDLSATDYEGETVYQEWLAQKPHRFDRNEDYEESIHLYRRILAASEEKVDILEIGFSSVLARLLDSKPDELSPLSGKELIKQKVGKLWMMAGKWDEPNGKEYNFSVSEKAMRSGEKICSEWPTPVTFLGFEIGFTVITGDTLTGKNDILKNSMRVARSPLGRFSWDPMLVLMACIHDEAKAGYKLIKGTASVNGKTGENNFVQDINGRHGYVIKLKDDDFYKNSINRILESRENKNTHLTYIFRK